MKASSCNGQRRHFVRIRRSVLGCATLTVAIGCVTVQPGVSTDSGHGASGASAQAARNPGPSPRPAPTSASSAQPVDDASRVHVRNGKLYVIEKFEKRFAVYDQSTGWVRPLRGVNVAREIVREDADFVWVWTEVAAQETDPEPSPASAEDHRYFETLRRNFELVEPLAAAVSLRFEEASRGLPVDGSWRNSLAVADMNRDGLPDLIAPPQRAEVFGAPHIFLQNRDGSWSEWQGLIWPRSVNYGSVAAADVNRDGHQDLIIGAHLSGVVVFLGDGKGRFTDSSEGLPNDFPTRRVIVADADADGWPDLIALSEGPGALQRTPAAGRRALLRVYLNEHRAESWRLLDVSGNERVAGDWLAAGDFNGDRVPDFVASSIYFNSPQVIYLSGQRRQWKSLGRGLLPFYSYYFAVAAGRFRTNGRTDDAILTYGRAWPSSAAPIGVVPPEARSVVGIDRLSWDRTGPHGVPIARWASDRPVWGMAAGDFNGDSHLDLVYARAEPHDVVILLNNGKGDFRRAAIEGLVRPANTTYDIRVADVDRDGRPDIVMMFESRSDAPASNGSIRVFLNRTHLARTRSHP